MTESSLLMQTRWSWAADIVTGQYSRAVEVAGHRKPLIAFTGDPSGIDEGYPIVTTKNKVRGRGRVLQMTFRSTPGKDFELVGYGMFTNKNSGV